MLLLLLLLCDAAAALLTPQQLAQPLQLRALSAGECGCEHCGWVGCWAISIAQRTVTGTATVTVRVTGTTATPSSTACNTVTTSTTVTTITITDTTLIAAVTATATATASDVDAVAHAYAGAGVELDVCEALQCWPPYHRQCVSVSGAYGQLAEVGALMLEAALDRSTVHCRAADVAQVHQRSVDLHRRVRQQRVHTTRHAAHVERLTPEAHEARVTVRTAGSG